MPRKVSYRTTVEFGDCDPAGIAFYANFFRWYDAAIRHFFATCGVPPWRELERSSGIIGTPVVETNSRYLRPLSYGDTIEVTTWVEEWHDKRFLMRHEVRSGGELCAEARETRIFAIWHPDREGRLRAVPIPQDIAAMCA